MGTGAKLTDHFQMPSVQRYVLLRADRAMVTHHRRRDDGGIETQTPTDEHVRMAPPDISIAVSDLYAP